MSRVKTSMGHPDNFSILSACHEMKMFLSSCMLQKSSLLKKALSNVANYLIKDPPLSFRETLMFHRTQVESPCIRPIYHAAEHSHGRHKPALLKRFNHREPLLRRTLCPRCTGIDAMDGRPAIRTPESVLTGKRSNEPSCFSAISQRQSKSERKRPICNLDMSTTATQPFPFSAHHIFNKAAPSALGPNLN